MKRREHQLVVVARLDRSEHVQAIFEAVVVIEHHHSVQRAAEVEFHGLAADLQGHPDCGDGVFRLQGRRPAMGEEHRALPHLGNRRVPCGLLGVGLGGQRIGAGGKKCGDSDQGGEMHVSIVHRRLAGRQSRRAGGVAL